MGGSSRADVQSLVVLRPIAAIMLAVAIFWVRKDDLISVKSLLWVAGLWLALIMLHLFPLPYAIWSSLPGRTLLVEIDKAAGLGQLWRPISMAPNSTWNSLYAMLIPLAVLAGGISLSVRNHEKLLLVWIMLGLLGTFVALLQPISAPGSALYFYRITNAGDHVGFFANRNHYATALAMLFPMLAGYATMASRSVEQHKRRLIFCSVIALYLVPTILVIGSRSGLIMGVLGLIGAVIIYRRPVISQLAKRKTSKNYILVLFAALAVFVVGLMTTLFSQALSIDRISSNAMREEDRLEFWQPIFDMSHFYQPAGTGFGTFVEAYQINEPTHLMNYSYLNHAHNDWLELYLTAGIPGILLLIALLLLCMVAAIRAFRTQIDGMDETARISIILARTAFMCIIILAGASLTDYPLRTPSMMALGMCLLLWLLRLEVTKKPV
jgi:O-antigen ligase